MAYGKSDKVSSEFSSLDLETIPMLAVNYSTRLHLSKLLNIEQTLPNSKLIPRDFRGLAELMGFDYTDIRNFQRNTEPAKVIIEAWESQPGSSVGALMKMLDELERFDILDEILPILEKNVMVYVRSRERKAEQPLQVAEISSCRQGDINDNPDHLALYDGNQGLQFYDAYVCYADNDIGFVQSLMNKLEHPLVGIKLFIRERDLRLGIMEYDAYVRLIEERCKRVLVIISPDFMSSPECEFQAKFAARLGIEQRSNKIIPIIYKPCIKIDPILSCLSKVDFTRPMVQEWAWNKIVDSLKAPKSQSFVVQQNMLPAPPRAPLPLPPNEPQFEASPTPIVEEFVSETLTAGSSEPGPSTPSGSRKQKWYKTLKNRFQSTSSASSGFHSQATSE